MLKRQKLLENREAEKLQPQNSRPTGTHPEHTIFLFRAKIDRYPL